eukprot:10755055-Heterocapsa_arctica.AAC.1
MDGDTCGWQDDLVWAYTPVNQNAFDAIEKEFKFCDKKIKQANDFSSKITCGMTSKKLGQIRLSRER